MKRSAVILCALLLVAFSLPSCANKAAAPKAGSAKASDMLNLLPVDAKGVVVVDVHRIMQTEAAGKAIADNKNKAKYDEFVQISGIDPQKDVFYFVGAAMGDIGQKDMDGVGLVNLKYDKEKLLALLKKERGEMTTEEYNGCTIYTAASTEENKPVSGVFLDESNVLFGTAPAVKKVIDVHQKKADNIWKNENVSTLLKGMNTGAMLWAGFAIPADTMQQASSQNPMLGAFSKIQALVISFDYKDKNVLAEIKALSPGADTNKQMADALNGFKALGAGAAAKEPMVGELLNKIDISSAEDHVKISAVIPEALIESLSQKVKVSKPQEEQKQEQEEEQEQN
jgi:Protein of unknown function (DUF3352)